MATFVFRHSVVAAMYRPRFHIVLFQPEIPPNTGAVGRTCVALEAKLWLVRPLGFRVDDSTLRRAGLDYWQHLQWQVVDHWDQLVTELDASRFWFFSKTATLVFTEARFERGDALVFGNETSGLPPSLLAANCQRAVRIPTGPGVRSLNLSCSVAVAGYEVDRQLHDQTAPSH
jgi:tRNA (cytidine/uridine-2'-O-)-methyltransferase